MSSFSRKLLDLLPPFYAESGMKRIVSATAATGNLGDTSIRVTGRYKGNANQVYTVRITVGGAPPAARYTVMGTEGDDAGEKGIPTFGVPLTVGWLGVSLAFLNGGSGVLTVGDSWTIRCSAGDLHDFLDVLGAVLDECSGRIDGFAALMSWRDAPDRFLPFLGYLLEYDWDYRRPAAVQRSEIGKLIQVYQLRGKIPGMLRKLRLAGYRARIHDDLHAHAVALGAKWREKKLTARISDSSFSVERDRIVEYTRGRLLKLKLVSGAYVSAAVESAVFNGLVTIVTLDEAIVTGEIDEVYFSRGLARGVKLGGKKHCHGTFEVVFREVCRELDTLMIDDLPRGKRMFSFHVDAVRKLHPVVAGTELGGDGPFQSGVGGLPFKLYRAGTTMGLSA